MSAEGCEETGFLLRSAEKDDQYANKGWVCFPPEPAVTKWAEAALSDAKRALNDPALAHLYQCEDTWFVGLDALDNDAQGRVAGSELLSGRVVEFIRGACGGWPALHRAQVSGVFPGYPRPREGESDAGFRYRLKRDAAHVDGIIGIGQPKRRFVQEPHAFILGLPLSEADQHAAPLVVWEGSHLIMRRAFQDAFKAHDPATLSRVDVTEIYQAARAHVFESCPRVVAYAPVGAAVLVHRMTVHGVGPWQAKAHAATEGRVIAYFRPPMPGGVQAWAKEP